eukprot:11796815-Heterocapsa_arctica.AAC.1
MAEDDFKEGSATMVAGQKLVNGSFQTNQPLPLDRHSGGRSTQIQTHEVPIFRGVLDGVNAQTLTGE